MKFDVVVGNPPYQDGSKKGGQNKIYNQISKKALDIAKNMVAFITPTSVLKKSKRFSLIGLNGLKFVDFTANNHFNVGTKICYWIIDKKYNGNIIVSHDNGITHVDKNSLIFDYSMVDESFANLYMKLKKLTNTPSKRMFAQNAVDAKNGRSLNQDKIYQYPIYKITDNGLSLIQYNKPTPKYHNKLKFIISMTKSIDKAIIVDVKDCDVNHLCIEIQNIEEVENLKSFILSDYFQKFCNKWKIVDGYGFNNALKHLPPFDKTKKWTNEEVKHFMESFK